MQNIDRYYVNPAAAVSGEWTGNTLSMVSSLMRQFYVKAASADTTFDVEIVDRNSVSVRKFTDNYGTLNDLTPLPTQGKYTINITNSSADEDYVVQACFSIY